MKSNYQKKSLTIEQVKNRVKEEYEELCCKSNSLKDVFFFLMSSNFLNKSNFYNYEQVELAKEVIMEIFKKHLKETVDEIINDWIEQMPKGRILLRMQELPDVIEKHLKMGNFAREYINELQNYWNEYINQELEKYYEEHPEEKEEDIEYMKKCRENELEHEGDDENDNRQESQIEQGEKKGLIEEKNTEESNNEKNDEKIIEDEKVEKMEQQSLDFFEEVKNHTDEFKFLGEASYAIDCNGRRIPRKKFKNIENAMKYVELQEKIQVVMLSYKMNEERAIRFLLNPEEFKHLKQNEISIDEEETKVLIERLDVLDLNREER